jgi:RNA polymerase sigma factor (sigma-70 family)
VHPLAAVEGSSGMTSRADAHATPEQDFLRWREHGEGQALGRVFDALAPELLLVAAHVAGRREAEDLVQATFLAAITAAPRWDATRPLLPWLAGVLANLALRERAKAARTLDTARVAVPAAEADPADDAERADTAQALARALQGMPRHYRQALTLRLVHGLEPLAIAHALGAPPATVKSRLQRGLDLLRNALPAGLRLPAIAPFAAPSLDAVRAEVLRVANAQATAATVVAGTAIATTAAGAAVAAAAGAGLGGLVVMKKSLVIALALACATALTFGLQHALAAPEPAPSAPPSASTAAAPVRAAPPPAPDAPPPPADRTAVAASAPVAAAPLAPAVRGRVVDEQGAPLPGVLVVHGDKQFSPFQSQADFRSYCDFNGELQRMEANGRRTAADGAFELPPPGNARPHLLAAWSPERSCRALDVPADLSAPLAIVLPRDPIVRGAVRSRVDRKPIAGAQPQVWPANSGMPIAHRSTDAEGRYALLPLPPGAYRMQVDAEGFASGSTTFTLQPGPVGLEVDVELEPLPVFAAELVDGAGQPWVQARIAAAIEQPADALAATLSPRAIARRNEGHVESWRVQPVRVDAEGRLHGFVRDPQANVLAVWNGSEKLFEVAGVDLTATRIVAELLPRPTVALQVRVRFDPPREPMPEVELALFDPAGIGGWRSTPVRSSTVRQPVATLPVPVHFAGRTCGLRASSAGCAPFQGVVAVPANEDSAWVEIVLSPADRTLKGVVVGADGEPVPRATVYVADAAGNGFLPLQAALREAAVDGTFAIPGLPKRAMRLFVEAQGHGARALAVDTGSEEPVRVELRAARAVSARVPKGAAAAQFRVLDANGLPLADDRIRGTMRYGGGQLELDAAATTVEAYDGQSGALLGTGAISAEGKAELAPPR